MKENNGKVKPFGMKDRLGYHVRGLRVMILHLYCQQCFCLSFIRIVMGVSAAIVGLMMMAARFVDAVTDVRWDRL